MSLRDEITKEVWATIIGDQDRDQAADAILALVRAHLTSDEAVLRASEAHEIVWPVWRKKSDGNLQTALSPIH